MNYFIDELRRDTVTAILEKLQGDTIRKANKNPNIIKPDVYDDVEELSNNAYINQDGCALAMDIYKPVKAKGKLPAIVNIHGGGLISGSRKMNANFARLLAHKGYVVFVLDYRLVPRSNVCDQLDDIYAGIDYIGNKIKEYNIDKNRFFLVGDSAGAYLATMISAMTRSKSLQRVSGHNTFPFKFAGVGFISGMFYTQLQDPIGYMLADQFFGEKHVDEEFRKHMDPEHPVILENIPPAFLITSRGDFLNNYSLKFHKALKSAGKKTHIIYYGEKELGHAFVSENPTLPQSNDAIDKMLKWLETQATEERNSLKKSLTNKELKTLDRIENGNIRKQKAWQYIKEINSASEDKLNAVALIDARGRITYKKMFKMWDSYAAAFSGLGITSENNSRLGLVGLCVTESICALYAANMVGAMVSGIPADLNVGADRWKRLIKEEKLTDLLIMDTFIDPRAFKKLLSEKKKLGLRNIILVHVKLDSKKEDSSVIAFSEFNYNALKNTKGAVYWEDKLKEYKDYPIFYAKYNKNDIALAVHTSGTTKGIHKPMFFSDYAWNGAAHRVRMYEEVASLPTKKANAVFIDMSQAYSVINELHLMFSLGGAIIPTYFQMFTDEPMDTCVKTSCNVLMSAGLSFIRHFENPQIPNPDFSNVDMIILGGSYVSADTRKRINEYVRENYGDAKVINGYGMSEIGGACIISPSKYNDDSIGFPLPGVNVRILGEDNKFYKIEDGPRTGTMYLNSDTMSTGRLGNKVFYETTNIDGLPYYDTYDSVRVNENGSLTYIGRSNRYFINSENVRFEAGKVEVAISSQDGVVGCGLSPAYSKIYHDTMPVLVIKVLGKDKADVVKKAILNAYTENNLIKDSNLPYKCVIVDELPYTANGKVDVYRITKGDFKGDIYAIVGVYKNDKLADIELDPAFSVDSMLAFGKEVGPDELNDTSKPVGIFALMALNDKWGLLPR